MGSYVPTTAAEREEMLAAIGVKSLEDLYAGGPAGDAAEREAQHPRGHERAGGTRGRHRHGGEEQGLQDRSARCGCLPPLHSRRCEVLSPPARSWSPATRPIRRRSVRACCKASFEFQTMICELTGMDVANASPLRRRDRCRRDHALCAATASARVALCFRLREPAGHRGHAAPTALPRTPS